MVLALLVGKLTGNPDGVTNEEVSIKKISNRNIKSVIDAMLNAASTLFRDCKFIAGYLGSCNRSINSMDEYSILCTTLETRVTK